MLVPLKVSAGTTIAWSVPCDGDSSATYKYFLLSGNGRIVIDATYTEGVISVAVAADISATYAPGRYKWFLVSESDSFKYELDSGFIEISPDPFAAETAETQSHNQRMLDAICARLEGRILADTEEYTIDGRSVSRIPIVELQKLKRTYALNVAREKRQQAGKSTFRPITVKTRFTQ